MSAENKSRRIHELDLLRGFFICVIILDHLQFWPSPFQYMTGQGKLWASAAEGFFLISGLLVGYLRAYKGAHTPLRVLTKKLLSRAAMLYMWGVLITFVVVALSVLLPGDGSRLPRLPDSTQVSSLFTYVTQVISTNFTGDWIYFLRLYAIMLAVTPLFLWLIRKGWWWIGALISVSLYALSWLLPINEAGLQWQILFFGAALLGWKLEAITGWLRANPLLKKSIMASLIAITFMTFALSYFMVHGWSYVESPKPHPLTRETYVSIRANIDPLFSNNPMAPLRVLLAFTWFSGLLALFHLLKGWLLKWLDWILLPFGTASLTAYCLQALVLPFIVTFVTVTSNFWLNGLMASAVLLLFLVLIKLPLVRRVLPR